MVYFERSQPAPECLAAEKVKPSGSYRCDGVAIRLKNDFKNKCYLCESRAPISINIEHFKAHRGDRELMFQWENLFFCCTHCNSVKQMMHLLEDLLDCTDSNHEVDRVIHYSLEPFPGERVVLNALKNDPLINETTTLLLAIYNNVQTEQKEIESANLRMELLADIKRFQRKVEKYMNPALDANKRSQLRQFLASELETSSAFTAFKRWIIRDSPVLMAEFGNTF